MSIEIKEVSKNSDIKTFIDFPHTLYKDDPLYVPELFMAQKEVHSKKKNHYFDHAEVRYYLAYKDGKIAGRLVAHLDAHYNDYHNSNTGMFGFYDVIDDFEVSNALFDKACTWLRSKNVSQIMGPFSFNLTTDTGGMLIEGFDRSPMIMMTYNKPYYNDHVQQYGFAKEMDLQAYMIYTNKVSEKSIRLSKLLEERLARTGITIRPVNLKDFKEEVRRLKIIYDKAWEKNWGFVPATDAEFDHLAEGLKLLVDPKWCYIAEDKGEPIGFFLSLPNINEITKNFKKGRLFPFNIIRLMRGKKKVKHVRILTLGVVEAYRNKGIEAIFYARNIMNAKEVNLIGGEASWILENNKEMVQGAKKLNGELYKTYRIYSKAL